MKKVIVKIFLVLIFIHINMFLCYLYSYWHNITFEKSVCMLFITYFSIGMLNELFERKGRSK